MGVRKATRYKPDPMTLGYLDLDGGKTFKPTLVGIVINESYSGCAAVVASDLVLKVGQKIRAKIGALDPMKAEIIWTKVLEENIQKIGIKLLE